jgi:hypothetical protein
LRGCGAWGEVAERLREFGLGYWGRGMSEVEDILDEFDDGSFFGSRSAGLRKQSLTHCVHGHEWTKESTYWLHGYRQCRICADIRRRAYNQKHVKPPVMRFNKRENLLLRLGLQELLRCIAVDPCEDEMENYDLIVELETLLARFGEHTSDWLKRPPEKLDAA